jgi:hypothetical protein
VQRHPDFQAWLQGVWQDRPQGGLVGVPNSKRPQVDDVQYPRVPIRILKGTSHEEVINDETDEIMLILNVWSVETSRYPA